jgi:Arc/MetJ family transcription regulator
MARTVVNLRDDLVQRARRLTGLKRKVDVVNAGLAALVEREQAHRALRRLRGRGGFRVTGDELLRERHGSRR